MAKQSAGLLVYRLRESGPEVLLVHPGGPLWSKRDLGVWSIPKGEYGDDEDALTAALREFQEETGVAPPDIEWIPLGTVKQRGGKVVAAWTGAFDLDADSIRSNTFEMEWPPRSGKTAEFQEVDRAAWFDLATARQRINPAQEPFLDRLVTLLSGD